MGSRRVLRGLAALTILTSLVAACGDDDDDAADAQEIDITAIDYAFSEAPTELDAGAVTVNFSNDGEVDHEAGLVEIGDTPLEEFLPAFEPVFVEEGSPIPASAGAVAAPLEAGPGEAFSATFTLSEGTWALICTFDGDAEEEAEGAEGEEDEGEGEEEAVDPARIHFNRGMAQILTVGPATGATDLPDADGTITATDWTFDADVAGGDTSFNFLSEGPDEIHFVGITSYPTGTDPAAVEEAFAASFASEDGSPPEGSPEPENEEFGFSGLFSSGLGSRVELEDGFESGKTYLLVCFMTDRAGGPPHAFPPDQGGHGMYEAITVE